MAGRLIKFNHKKYHQQNPINNTQPQNLSTPPLRLLNLLLPFHPLLIPDGYPPIPYTIQPKSYKIPKVSSCSKTSSPTYKHSATCIIGNYCLISQCRIWDCLLYLQKMMVMIEIRIIIIIIGMVLIEVQLLVRASL